MKVSFSNRSLGDWLTKKQVGWGVVSLICFLAGSYFVGRYFGFLAFVMLGIPGILFGTAVGAWRKWNRVKVTHTVLPMNNVPQVMSRWDYRPRDIIRRNAAFESGGAATPDVAGASASNENDNVWFNFTNLEATIEQAPTTAPLSGDP